MRGREPRLGAILALGLGIVCIGFSAIFVKLATGVPGPASAFYRVLIAGVVVVPWWLAVRRPLPAARELRLLVAGGIFFGLDLGLWNSSILLVPAATATLLANNAPVWVGLGGFVLFHERLSRRYWLGLAVALAGMMWLVGADAFQHLRLNAGNLLAVGASFFYAAFLLTTHRARMKVDLLTTMAVSAVASILTLLAVNLVMGTALTGYGPRAWVALAALGLISQLGGWLSINYALGHLPAAPVSVCLLAQTGVTALAAMPILGEFLKANQLVGGLVLLAGIYLVTSGRGQVPAVEKVRPG